MAHPDREADSPATPHQSTISDPLFVIGSDLERLADLAPTLKEAELRVYLELWRRAARTGKPIRASSRDLANCCKAGRRNIQYALDNPTTRGLLTMRQGDAKNAAYWQVNAPRTIQLGGVATTPPPTLFGWSPNDATPASLQRHPGVETTPPPTESEGLNPSAPRVDVIPTLTPILDRVLRSKPKDHDPKTIAHFRKWLHGYMAKFGIDPTGKPLQSPHPPDDDVVAQFLTLAEPDYLQNLLYDWMHEKQAVYSYAWFVTAGLQRIHGINFKATSAARQTLKLLKRGQRPQEPAEQLPLHGADFLKQAIAGVKNLR